MIATVTEIKLKSGDINEEMILSRYYDKGVWYQGEYYDRSGIIKDVLSKKALSELKHLIMNGSKIDFENVAQIKFWIEQQTGIESCSLSVVG